MNKNQAVYTGDTYFDAVQWTAIETGGAQQLLVPINKAAVAAGGNTIFEMRVTGVGNFPTGTYLPANDFYTYTTNYVAETRIATICDDKDNYRFGFNGMEKDNEVKGLANSLDFGARTYDSRLGRWLSLDPLAAKYPGLSPYNFVGNSPIWFIDPNGEEIKIRDVQFSRGRPIVEIVTYKNGELFNKDGSKYIGTNPYILSRSAELNTLRKNDARFEKVISDLENHKNGDQNVTHIISNIVLGKEGVTERGQNWSSLPSGGSQVQTMNDPNLNVIKFVPDFDRETYRSLSDNSNEEILIHEIKHDWNDAFSGGQNTEKTSNGIKVEEVDAVNFQNIQREKEGKAPRATYSGKQIPQENLVAPSDYQLK